MSAGTNDADENEVTIRPARKEDMAAVAEMIQELADFENMPDGPKLTEKELVRDGFECRPARFRCAVAARGARLAGYALHYPTYSTWGGAATALEDLYVRPAARRRGVGGRLFQAVAKEAAEAGCRLDFHVLEWNPAREFYARRGAADLTRDQRWHCYRLEGDALRRLAATTP